jgi:hypothetical protein
MEEFMTSQTSKPSAWRRAAIGAMASGALVAGMLAGAPQALSDPEAPADPASPITPGPANQGSPITPGGAAAAAGALPGEMTADQALAIIASDYDTGAGGGKLSQLIHSVLKLRAQGFYPSQGNRSAIVAALDKRPNQAPLIAALESTLAFQRRNQQRGMASGNQGTPSIAINQYPQYPPRQAQVPGGDDDASISIPLG